MGKYKTYKKSNSKKEDKKLKKKEGKQKESKESRKSFKSIGGASLVPDEDFYRVRDECYNAVQEIIDQGEKYVDEDFPLYDPEVALQTLFGYDPHKDSSFGGLNEDPFVTERITEHNPDIEYEVFTDGASAHDIVQGGNGTCFYLGGLMCVAEHEKFIKKLVVHYSIELGVYGIMFFANEWTYVIIDDYNVYSPEGARVFSGSVDERELWVVLFEKAYAKLHGSYDMVDGGYGEYAIVDLTGGIPVVIDKNSWEEFHGAVQSGYYCMTCSLEDVEGTDKDETDDGLIPGHVYSVLNTLEYDDICLVNVRNPHGGGEWRGDYSDNSPLWTEELKEAAALEEADDGSFWMPYEEFTTWFGLESVRIFDKSYHFTKLWGESSYEYTEDTDNAALDHLYYEGYFLLTLPEAAEAVFCLTQNDLKKQSDWDSKRNDFFAVGYSVLKFDSEVDDIPSAYEKGEYEIIIDTGDIGDHRDLARAEDLDAGNYALIPRFDYGGCQYSVRIFTNASSYEFEYYCPEDGVPDREDEEDQDEEEANEEDEDS